MQQELHDADLVLSVLRGDKSSYAILVERYQAYVFTITSRLIPLREEAEDVSQEVFVKAYLSLAGFKGNSKFSTWLYTIAHTTAISHLRKNSISTSFMGDEQLADTGYKTNDDPEKTTHNNTIKQAVNDAIKKLPADDAEIITLFYLAGQSIEEIALIMNIGNSNAKVKLHRARQKLKEIVVQVFGQESTLLYRN